MAQSGTAQTIGPVKVVGARACLDVRQAGEGRAHALPPTNEPPYAHEDRPLTLGRPVDEKPAAVNVARAWGMCQPLPWRHGPQSSRPAEPRPSKVPGLGNFPEFAPDLERSRGATSNT